jgi:hypothetical protein
MPLEKGKKYEFRIRAENKKFLALMYGKNFIQFEYDADDIFFLDAEIPANINEITIGSSNSLRGSYQGILQYKVK